MSIIGIIAKTKQIDQLKREKEDIKQEIVLCIAAVLAIISMFFMQLRSILLSFAIKSRCL